MVVMVPAPQPLRAGPLPGGPNLQAFPYSPRVVHGERVLPVLAYLLSETSRPLPRGGSAPTECRLVPVMW